MDHRERIRLMQAEGILSAGQADRLRESLGVGKEPPQATPVATGRRRVPPVVLLIAGSALVILLMVILAGGQGSEVQVVQDVSQSLNDPQGPGNLNRPTMGMISFIVLVVLVPLLLVVFTYNGLVTREEDVFEAWAQVESNYQRRADLVPRLVEAVGRYMRHEQETLQNVTEARFDADAIIGELVGAQHDSSRALSQLGGEPPTSATDMEAVENAAERVSRELARLVAVAEQYPELRAGDQFLELQAQLEGTENRINVARMRFNTAAAEFNAAARRMPASLVASWGGFKRKAYFRSDAGAEDAGPLDFE